MTRRAEAPIASQRGFAWATDGDAVHGRVVAQLAAQAPVASATVTAVEFASAVADFKRHRHVFLDALDTGAPWPTLAVMADPRGLEAPALAESVVGVGVDRAALTEALTELDAAGSDCVTVSWHRLRAPLRLTSGGRSVVVSPLMLCPRRGSALGYRASDGCGCRDCASLRRWGQP